MLDTGRRIESVRQRMRVLAPAKLNLTLRVGLPRDDGFHPLSTWMCTIGLFDTLLFEPAGEPGIRLTCEPPGLPVDETNLVLRAAHALTQARASRASGDPREGGGLRVRLEKRIPVGAGLGGGSSDGAHALLALNRLWKLDWPMTRLADLAATLGSDLPFFFHGPSSVCTGRGEVVQPIAPPRPRWAVLVLPGVALPTAEVYRRFDVMGLGAAAALSDRHDWPNMAALPARPLLEQLQNDLEPAAFALRPDLGQLRQQLEQRLDRPVRMSGSGSSLFTLYDEQAEAEQACGIVRRERGLEQLRVETVAVAPQYQDDLNTSDGEM